MILPVLSKSETIDLQRWQHLIDQASYTTSDVLNARIPGNHFFWYGETGAEETLEKVDVLRILAQNLKANIKDILSKVSNQE